MRFILLVIIEFFEFALFDSIDEYGYFIWMKFAYHLSLFSSIRTLHILYKTIINITTQI
jgi:hypothetical protein